MTDSLENIKQVIQNNKYSLVSPLDLVNPNTEWAEESLSNERYSICKSCPELIKLTKQCKKCGCFMAAKTKLQLATCPLGKW
jgi:hypothetical protein